MGLDPVAAADMAVGCSSCGQAVLVVAGMTRQRGGGEAESSGDELGDAVAKPAGDLRGHSSFLCSEFQLIGSLG